MKKVLIILLVLISLTSCKAKKEEYYSLQIGDITITVGYDEIETIKDVKEIESYSSIIVKKKELITDLTIYADDTNKDIKINDISISNGINNVCNTLEGTLIEKNGYTCVLNKLVDNVNNTVILYGDILEDNLDKVDRIEINYNLKEK